jgi:hypothetical protein
MKMGGSDCFKKSLGEVLPSHQMKWIVIGLRNSWLL